MKTLASMTRVLGLSAAAAAAFAIQPVAAQTVSNNGQGSAVVVPYYTINNGWATLVNLTNTTDNSIVVKFRLHEARNSRDVLDFNIALSPYDVWSAFVTEGPGNAPRLVTEDRSCTIPDIRDSGASASNIAYSGEFVDFSGSDGDNTRMHEGYIEVLTMGESEDIVEPAGSARGNTAYYAEHENGEPRDCARVVADFANRGADWGTGIGDTIPGQDAGAVQTGSGSPLARLGSVDGGGANESTVGYGPIVSETPIKVNVSYVNSGNGIAAAADSLHIAGWGLGENLVTAQEFPWFLEPALASSDGLWTTSALGAIGDGIASSQVKNEWTSNPSTGASSDWTITFPTKRFDADEDAGNIQAACNVWRNDGSADGVPNGSAGGVWSGWGGGGPTALASADCPDEGFPNVFQDGNTGNAPIVVRYDIYDREEGGVQVTVDGPVISPAPPPEITIENIPFEVNVLKIAEDAANTPSAIDSQIALAIDTAQLASGDPNGWLQTTFLDGVGGSEVFYPVTGFIFKKRDFGNAALNFGQATEHAYTRQP